MGLDAHVYCDCFERGRLRTPPRTAWDVYVDEHGGCAPRTKDTDEQIAFDRWRNSHACEHQDGWLLHHRLGNIALIGLFRQLLNPHADRLPVVVHKIIYSGTHCGDRLDTADVEKLSMELTALATIHAPRRKDEAFLRDFEQQLRELVAASRSVGKPIVF